MKKIIYISVVLLSALQMLNAQQIGMYNYYFYKPTFYNPAYAGQAETAEAMIINHSQWTSFANGPQLNVATTDGSIKDKKIGIGLNLVSDKRGINKRAGGNIMYSYRMNFNDDTYLAFGLAVGVISHSIDYTKVVAENYNDPTLFYSSQQKTALDGNAGLLFVWKGLQFSASAPQLFGNRVNFLNDTAKVQTYYTQARHYIGSLKYNFTLSEESGLYLAPQAQVILVPGAPLQYSGNLNFSWKNKCWLGATYKSSYAVAANAGVSIGGRFDVGYSYEFIMGNLAKYSGISHEIMVNLKFGKGAKNDSARDTTALAQQEKNEGYENKIDSLNEELSENQRKIAENDKKVKDLTNKLEELKKAQQQLQQKLDNMPANTSNSGNQISNNAQPTNNNGQNSNNGQTDNTGNINNNNGVKNTGANTNVNNANVEPDNFISKETDNGVLYVTSNVKDYKTVSGGTPSTGFYVVIGTFFYQDFAENEADRVKKMGMGKATYIYSKTKQYHYVYVDNLKDKESAKILVMKLKNSGYRDAWVKVLQ